MPQLSLEKYVDEVALKVQNGRVDEAIDHCRHILSHYPMYLPVYRLLGYASIEKGDYAHATHFFQSVLSADPEDADAWMNLATLSDDLGELEQATWLMERAFEIEPGNAEIRDGLRQFYSRRDGVERTRIKLTAGALGRLYAAGGFYRRAIQELEAILQSSPSLPPLHIAYLETGLAQAFWNTTGMAPMADKVSRSLTEKLPNCLQANLIMAQIRQSAGMDSEAEPYLKVARALDPEGRVAHKTFGDQSPIPLADVKIPYLERETEEPSIEQVAASRRSIDDTSWLDHVGRAFEAGADLEAITTPEGKTQPPEWLQEWSAETTAKPVPLTASPTDEGAEPVAEEPTSEPDQLPGWMTEMQQESIAEEAVGPPLFAEIDSEAAQVIGPAVSPEEDELPSWLQALSTEDEMASPLLADEEQSDMDIGGAELAEEELPEWLRPLSEQDLDLESGKALEPSVEDAFARLAPDEETPEWLQALSAQETAAAPIEEAQQGDLASTSDQDIPDWLQALSEGAIEAESTTTARQQVESVDQATPTWLADERGDEVAEPPAIPLEEVELPDWLSESPALAQDEEETLIEPAAETVDWLSEIESEAELEIEAPAKPLAENELPDWLGELRGPTEEEEDIFLAEPAAEAADWLSEIEPEAELEIEAPAELPAGDDLPGWLQELRPQTGILPSDLVSAPEESLPAAQVDVARIDQPASTAAAPVPTIELPPPVSGMPSWLVALEAEISGQDYASSVGISQESVGETDELEGVQPASERLADGKRLPPARSMPSWLAELELEISGQPAALAPEIEPALPAQAAPEPESAVELPTAADMPEWLTGLEQEITGQVAPATPQPVISVPPPVAEKDQEVETQVTPVEPVAAEVTTALPEMKDISPPDEEMPDWLYELELRVADDREDVVEQIALETPDRQVTAPPETVPVDLPPTITGEALPDEEDERPEWLRDLEAEPVAKLTVDEMPDWLEQLRSTEQALAHTVDEAEQEIPESAEAKEMDWLRDLQVEMPETVEAHGEIPTLKEVVESSATTAVEREVSEDAAVHIEPSQTDQVTADPEQSLVRARSYLDQGAPDAAAREYEQLTALASLHEDVIQQLEQAVQTYPRHHALHRVLGDAYMRSGQLNKALKAYREALTKLSTLPQ